MCVRVSDGKSGAERDKQAGRVDEAGKRRDHVIRRRKGRHWKGKRGECRKEEKDNDKAEGGATTRKRNRI